MNTSEIDRQRGAEVRWLGAFVLPVTQAIDDQLDGGCIACDALNCQRLENIKRLIRLIPDCMNTWESTVLFELHSDDFFWTYRHSVSSPLNSMINKVAALSHIKNAQIPSAQNSSMIQELYTHIIGHYRDHVRRLGLLFTAQDGIFDHEAHPDWSRSLPASVPIFDCNTQTMQQVASKELLIESGLRSPIWEPSAIVFQPQAVRWERVKRV